VFVTGADGEQMVLSGPEAAQLLAQAGISLGDNEQVMMADGEDNASILGQTGVEGTEEGIIQVPEGSTVTEDGSIVAADGTVLAPPGSVVTGEDGSLIMTQDASVMMQGGLEDQTGAASVTESGDQNIYATPDGQLVTASGQLVNAEGQLITADGQLVTPEGQLLTSSGGQLVTPEGQLVTSDGQLVTSEGQLVTSEGQLMTSEGQLVSSEGQLVTSEGQLVTSDGQLVTSQGQLVTSVAGQLASTEGSQLVTSDGQLVEGQVPTSGAQLITSDGQVLTSTADGQYVTADGQMLTTDQLTDLSDAGAKAVTDSVPTTEPALASSDAAPPLKEEVNISPASTEATAVAVDSSTADVVAAPPGQTLYTTSDGSVVSAPEGTIMATADGKLVTADGQYLTNADGTPVSLAVSSVGDSILPTTETETVHTDSPATGSASLAMPEGGIMVSAASGTIMTASEPALATTTDNLPSGLLANEEGVISAPEGSMITEDGSLVAADGTVLAPPGSIVTENQEQPPPQPVEQEQPPPAAAAAAASSMPTGNNLIGLQLPDENGEVLYLNPNDPAHQMLLQEAGITMGEGGVLQTADGQILTNDEGNPITSNIKQPAKNNLVGDAVAAAGLGEDLGFQLNSSSSIDLPLSSQQGMNELRPELPSQTSGTGYDFAEELKSTKTTFTPRSSAAVSQPQQQQQQQQKYQKLTFNSSAAYGSNATTTTTPVRQTQQVVQRKPVQKLQKRGSSEVSIGPDQQKVTYTVTSENGYSQTYMMICSKTLDQNTLINTLIKNISNDPNHKGKKTIKITQHKYGTKKKTQQKPLPRTTPQTTPVQQQQQRLEPVRTVTQTKTQYRNLQSQQVVRQTVPQPPQQILASEADMSGIITGDPINAENLSLEDIVNQIGETDGDPKVIVRCSYCTCFKSVLNSGTWENILNHILPVAREELHTAFYGNILKNFSRGLKVAVSGKAGEYCEVTVTHGLICRRTGTWYPVDNPGVDLAIQLATHIAAVQPGVVGPYGARPRGNSLICLFCASPYTAEDYQRHLGPHHANIVPCLLLAAGAYCANSFETTIKKAIACDSCGELEHQDMRFLPCTRFATEFHCAKKLQATVDCFRENFDSRGFLQVSNSAMTKCSVCRNQQATYCALFKINNSALLTTNQENEMLAVCANCQKQFVNVVMRESSFDRQLKMFQLHHMEQLCGVLRVLLSSSAAICTGSHNLLYTVQEGGSLYSATNTVHTVVPARPLHTGNIQPAPRGLLLEENKNLDMSGTQIRFVCDQCKFSIDLTRLEHSQGKAQVHLVEMAIGVVLEHIVPHTDSLLAVIMTSAGNEVFSLKYEFVAHVEGEGSNRRINISLDRKIIPGAGVHEVSIQKELYKTIEAIKSRIKPDKKGHITVRNRYMFLDVQGNNRDPVSGEMPSLSIDINRYLESANSVITLYGASGCNTRLLEYYSECRLCSKFSFPDFRLTAAIRSKEGVSLCENCCETILSLCMPSEPERIPGRGEQCLLLGVEKNTGHRLVLSNQCKKWISADGVDKINTVSEVATAANIPDYNTTMVAQLKSHLLAVAHRSWTDPDCVTARAGFTVKAPQPMEGGKLPPIEVKVTLKPPKPKTPPPSRLQITPVSAKQVGRPMGANPVGRPRLVARGTPTTITRGLTPSVRGPTPTNSRALVGAKQQVRSATPTQKLVKITANRRIIPVRDPTSFMSPVRAPTAVQQKIMSAVKARENANSVENKQFVAKVETDEQRKAALRQALRASETSSSGDSKAAPKPAEPSTEKKTDVDMEDDFETLDAIANFISSSEPDTKEEATTDADDKADNSGIYGLQDEFTDNNLKCYSSQETATPTTTKPVEQEQSKSTETYKLPKGTVVTNVSGSPVSSEVPVPKTEEEAAGSETPVRIPATLKISEVGDTGVVKLQAGNSKVADVDVSDGLEARLEEAEEKLAGEGGEVNTLPTPASDATTSTKSTPTPFSKHRVLLSSSAISSQPRRPVGRPKKELATAVEPQQQLLLSAVDQTVLDDSNLESADEAAQPMGVMMQIIDETKLVDSPPKPVFKATPTSSRKIDITARPMTDKRKREEDTAALGIKKTKLVSTIDSTPVQSSWDDSIDQLIGQLEDGVLTCRYCQAEFKRKASFEKHLLVHSGALPFQCKRCGKSFSYKDRLSVEAFGNNSAADF